MSKELNTVNIDPVVLVYLRNEFYRKKYVFILGVFLLSLLAIVVLSFMLSYLVKHPPTPYYFPADSVSRLVKDTPVQQPNMTTQEVSDWMVHAVQQAMSYDFVNYRSQMQSAQQYFAEYGWQHYMAGLEASNNLLALTRRKLIIVAKVVAAPTLLTQGSLGGAYAWKFQMPILVTYMKPPYTEKSQFSNPLVVTVIVQRQNILTSNGGLGIVQMNSSLAISAPQENLEAPPS